MKTGVKEVQTLYVVEVYWNRDKRWRVKSMHEHRSDAEKDACQKILIGFEKARVSKWDRKEVQE